TSILPSLNVKTARSCRGILPLTHLAREGRMTVTIGRRELLVALGGAAAWPLAARGQQPAMPVVGLLSPLSPGPAEHVLGGIPPGSCRNRLRRGPERCHRVSLDGRALRPVPRAGG